MLDPFVTFQEAGFSQREDLAVAGSGGEYWSPELIEKLDWVRLAELARAIAAHHGCELAGSTVLSDGSVAFGMIENPRSAHPQRALVKITGWNERGATPTTILDFAREVSTARKTRGVLIAPLGFTPAALLAAQEHRIESIDATTLCSVLMGLPSERSDLFFVIATAGDYTIPTCPICLTKLSRVEENRQNESHSLMPVRRIEESGLVAEPIHCHGLEVPSGVEAQFLHEVKAREIRIHGHAFGDFICDGPLILEPGGTLTGTVAARSLKVQDGGELRGQFRILEGDLKPFVTTQARWQWRCRNPNAKPACSQVVFEPHSELESRRHKTASE